MRLATVLSVLLAALLAPITHANVLFVDPSGGGDYDNIPEAVAAGGLIDTVLVAAGTYAVTAANGWPVILDPPAPTLMSVAGAAATVLEGDGATAAFARGTADGVELKVVGFTIRNTTRVVDLDFGMTYEILFTDNIVESNGYGLEADNTMSDGLIARNTFINNGNFGISTYHLWGTIELNEIMGSPIGIKGVCCEEPLIRNNYIHDNMQEGIKTGFGARIEGNIIEGNGAAGVSTEGGPDNYVQGNFIRENETGLFLAYPNGIDLRFNDIHDNTTYDLMLGPASPAGTFDATHNWWGTTDPDAIAAGIWDCEDDPAVACCVIFEPCCASPGCPTQTDASTWGGIKAMYR